MTPTRSDAAEWLRGPASGFALMLVSTLTGTVMAVLIRQISADLHPFVVGFFRSLFGVMVFVPLVFRHGLAPLRTRRPGLHLFRGLVNATVVLTSFWALAIAPLAKVTALNFSSPLFASLLAVVLFREVLHPRRILALVAGFAGMLLIIRPGLVTIDFGAWLAVAAALAGALGTISVKALSRTESNTTILLYMGLISTPAVGLFAIPVWQTPNLEQLGWLVLLGLVGAITHLTLNMAIARTEVSALSPLNFTRLLWAALAGYVMFAEVPDVWTWAGGSLIFVAATLIAYRESRPGARPAATR